MEIGDGGDDDAGRGRSGRIRKKSAKVREMEEAEELEKQEKKAWKKEQKSAPKKGRVNKPAALKSPPSSPILMKPMDTMPVIKKLVKKEPELKSEAKKKIPHVKTMPTTSKLHEPAEATSTEEDDDDFDEFDHNDDEDEGNLLMMDEDDELPDHRVDDDEGMDEHDDEHDEEEDEVDDDDDEDDEDEGEDEEMEEEEEVVPKQIIYSNTAAMAMKLKTSSEKKAKKRGRPKKGDPPRVGAVLKDQQKKKRALSAYMLWCNDMRPKLLQENPGMDFVTQSKKLGEIWQTITDKQKINWKRKAQRRAEKKGSSMINTGKDKSNLVNKGGARQQPKHSAELLHHLENQQQQQNTEQTQQIVYTGGVISPIDSAAHLKLLGESLSIIGARLHEHQGKIAVQGSLSVLLDSLLCALGPLLALTNQVPELDGCLPDTHNQILDDIAYIMPGIG